MMTVQNLTGGYHGQEVLHDLTLELPQGEFTALLGPNGCGKTTLLKLCARLLEPTAGAVLLDGRDIAQIPRKEFAQLVSVLPQSRPVGNIPVASLVAHGRFPYLGYPRRMTPGDREAVEQAMELAGVARYRDKSTAELSGGQRQKVYLAMALAQDTPWVLLDEPTTYLDMNRQFELLELMTLMRRKGKTVVAVLHDLPQALEWADRVVVMEGGRIADQGAPGEVFARHTLDRVFGISSQAVEIGGRARYFFAKESREDRPALDTTPLPGIK